jgi:F-type H+-transporting ATPase subunit delta
VKTTKRARAEAKRFLRVCTVHGLLDENRVRQVVQRIIATRRHDCFAILSHFERLLKLELVRRTATIESPMPLPADLRAAIEADLTRRYGASLTIAHSSRPALIGGLRIQVGCDVYDGSVQARLAALEKTF